MIYSNLEQDNDKLSKLSSNYNPLFRNKKKSKKN